MLKIVQESGGIGAALSAFMSSRFKDQTITWFLQGEDAERLQATPDVEPIHAGDTRQGRFMLLVASIALVGSCALYAVKQASAATPSRAAVSAARASSP
jgi:hypothetical protein